MDGKWESSGLPTHEDRACYQQQRPHGIGEGMEFPPLEALNTSSLESKEGEAELDEGKVSCARLGKGLAWQP